MQGNKWPDKVGPSGAIVHLLVTSSQPCVENWVQGMVTVVASVPQRPLIYIYTWKTFATALYRYQGKHVWQKFPDLRKGPGMLLNKYHLNNGPRIYY